MPKNSPEQRLTPEEIKKLQKNLDNMSKNGESVHRDEPIEAPKKLEVQSENAPIPKKTMETTGLGAKPANVEVFWPKEADNLSEHEKRTYIKLMVNKGDVRVRLEELLVKAEQALASAGEPKDGLKKMRAARKLVDTVLKSMDGIKYDDSESAKKAVVLSRECQRAFNRLTYIKSTAEKLAKAKAEKPGKNTAEKGSVDVDESEREPKPADIFESLIKEGKINEDSARMWLFFNDKPSSSGFKGLRVVPSVKAEDGRYIRPAGRQLKDEQAQELLSLLEGENPAEYTSIIKLYMENLTGNIFEMSVPDEEGARTEIEGRLDVESKENDPWERTSQRIERAKEIKERMKALKDGPYGNTFILEYITDQRLPSSPFRLIRNILPTYIDPTREFGDPSPRLPLETQNPVTLPRTAEEYFEMIEKALNEIELELPEKKAERDKKNKKARKALGLGTEEETTAPSASQAEHIPAEPTPLAVSANDDPEPVVDADSRVIGRGEPLTEIPSRVKVKEAQSASSETNHGIGPHAEGEPAIGVEFRRVEPGEPKVGPEIIRDEAGGEKRGEWEVEQIEKWKSEAESILALLRSGPGLYTYVSTRELLIDKLQALSENKDVERFLNSKAFSSFYNKYLSEIEESAYKERTADSVSALLQIIKEAVLSGLKEVTETSPDTLTPLRKQDAGETRKGPEADSNQPETPPTSREEKIREALEGENLDGLRELYLRARIIRGNVWRGKVMYKRKVEVGEYSLYLAGDRGADELELIESVYRKKLVESLEAKNIPEDQREGKIVEHLEKDQNGRDTFLENMNAGKLSSFKKWWRKHSLTRLGLGLGATATGIGLKAAGVGAVMSPAITVPLFALRGLAGIGGGYASAETIAARWGHIFGKGLDISQRGETERLVKELKSELKILRGTARTDEEKQKARAAEQALKDKIKSLDPEIIHKEAARLHVMQGERITSIENASIFGAKANRVIRELMNRHRQLLAEEIVRKKPESTQAEQFAQAFEKSLSDELEAHHKLSHKLGYEERHKKIVRKMYASAMGAGIAFTVGSKYVDKLLAGGETSTVGAGSAVDVMSRELLTAEQTIQKLQDLIEQSNEFMGGHTEALRRFAETMQVTAEVDTPDEIIEALKKSLQENPGLWTDERVEELTQIIELSEPGISTLEGIPQHEYPADQAPGVKPEPGSVQMPETEYVSPEEWESENKEIPHIVEGVDRGEGLWETTRDMVKAGKITEAEWQEAWANTYIEGEHISKYNLVHPDDELAFVHADGDSPAHFEFTDNPNDGLSPGTDLPWEKTPQTDASEVEQTWKTSPADIDSEDDRYLFGQELEKNGALPDAQLETQEVSPDNISHPGEGPEPIYENTSAGPEKSEVIDLIPPDKMSLRLEVERADILRGLKERNPFIFEHWSQYKDLGARSILNGRLDGFTPQGREFIKLRKTLEWLSEESELRPRKARLWRPAESLGDFVERATREIAQNKIEAIVSKAR